MIHVYYFNLACICIFACSTNSTQQILWKLVEWVQNYLIIALIDVFWLILMIFIDDYVNECRFFPYQHWLNPHVVWLSIEMSVSFFTPQWHSVPRCWLVSSSSNPLTGLAWPRDLMTTRPIRDQLTTTHGQGGWLVDRSLATWLLVGRDNLPSLIRYISDHLLADISVVRAVFLLCFLVGPCLVCKYKCFHFGTSNSMLSRRSVFSVWKQVFSSRNRVSMWYFFSKFQQPRTGFRFMPCTHT